jgi:hypothetical protein
MESVYLLTEVSCVATPKGGTAYIGKKKARIKIQPVLNPISYEKPK